jgi:hypothetical protein
LEKVLPRLELLAPCEPLTDAEADNMYPPHLTAVDEDERHTEKPIAFSPQMRGAGNAEFVASWIKRAVTKVKNAGDGEDSRAAESLH